MKLGDPRVWLGAASLALVLALFLLDVERASPGPLASAHTHDAELSGAAGCKRCHGRGGESMAEACTACHGEIAAQVASAVGLHGTLDGAAPRACSKCHTEHHGDAAQLVDARAFALAGIPDRERFDHRHVGYLLTGRHSDLACAECHELADAHVLAKGEKRFLGLDQTCTTCHQDPHEGRFAKGCETCHGQEKEWGELESFAHTAAFPLTGAHAIDDCDECHAGGSAYAVEAVGGRTPPPARACEDCHESPHRTSFVARAAALLDTAPRASCEACHPIQTGAFAAADMAPRLHAASGFALELPHDQARCEDCHAPRPEGGRREYDDSAAARAPDDCAACHDDPHGGQFASAGAPAPRCVDCHARERFEPSRFDAAAHARTGFSLDGAHARTECDACHERQGDAPRAFRGVARACEACHEDAHRGGIVARAPVDLVPADVRAGACAACHTTESFDQVERERFDHARSTRFPLEGAHARAACEVCHVPAEVEDAFGRRFGFAASPLAGPSGECSACHADVHEGAFERERCPREVGARTGCARCHAAESFRELARAFDHGLWTAYPLEGGHAGVECAACHGELPPGSERRLGLARERLRGPLDRCDACHADPHRGAFTRVEPGVDCSACHVVASFRTFERAGFDHARWAAFALEGAHARAACEACHVPDAARPAGARRLGAACGRACESCHADPHAGQFARVELATGARASDCARCHASSERFAELDFDHARDSRFALDETHAKLACSKCHVPWPLEGGGTAVRYVPLGTQCADCHGFAVPAGGVR